MVFVVENLNKRFGRKEVLKDMSFKLSEGLVYGLVGTNGSGKTTLFNLVSGFLQPDSGLIRYKNTQLTKHPSHRRRYLGIGRTFQDLRLAMEQTVEENIQVCLEKITNSFWGSDWLPINHKSNKDIRLTTESIAEDFGITDLLKVEVRYLSYGQQKLLTLACCVASKSEFLLLDEPVTGISPKTKDKIAQIVQQLRTEGKTLLVIEHDPGFLSPICDEVLFLSGGKIRKFSSYEELRKDQYVQEDYV